MANYTLQTYYNQGKQGSTVRPPARPSKPFPGLGQYYSSPGQQMQTDQWGRPIPPSQLLRDKLAQGGSPGMSQPLQTIAAAPNPPAPTKPGGVAAPNGPPQVPGFIIAPNGGVFAKTGNENINRLLATGLVNFGANLAGASNSLNGGPPNAMVQQLFGNSGFIPSPFSASNAPYVPPALPGAPVQAPGATPMPPQYGLMNRTTLYG